MKIIVCYKIVHDENELVINRDKTIDESKASYMISPYDCNAVGAAMNLAATVEGTEVVVLTAGGEKVENGKMKKGILSRGPSAMYAVKDESLDSADSYNIAAALKAAVEKIGGADLIICGEGSGDVYNQQVGNMVGALMGVPTVNAVFSMTMSGENLVVERAADDGVEVLELALPAVVSVTSDICIPKIPSMKDIMGAGKKPSTVFPMADLAVAGAAGTETVSVLAPESTDRKQIVIKGDGDDEIAEFYNNIRKAIM